MTTPPTQHQLNEAFSNSHDLAPMPECWGTFPDSDAPPMVCGSGIGSFQWFPTEVALISFIRRLSRLVAPGSKLHGTRGDRR